MAPMIRTLFAGTCLLFSLSTAAAEDDRVQLARLLEAFLDGASVNDAAVHDRFWAEDLVYTSSDGRRFGKAEIMASLAQSETAEDETRAPPSYSGRDVAIRVFGNTAVLTFRLVAEQGGEVVGEYFNSGVFRRHGDAWRAINWQATRAAGHENAE